MNLLDSVPDSAKVVVSVSAPVLTFLGVTVQDWTYVLSAVVSLLFVIEKMPMFIRRMREVWLWMKRSFRE